jgi:hypothetical protein
VAGEIRQLAAELAAAPVAARVSLEYHDTGHTIDRGIEWTLRPSGGGGAAVLIAVNADKNPVHVSFGGLTRFRKAETLFEKHPAELSAGVLRDRYSPFGARVYKLST